MLCDSAIILRLQVGYYRFMHITSTFYSRTKVIAKSARTSPLHNFNIVCAAPMAKYSKVYLRNKKESNISTPLRYSFLSSIFVDQMSVKNVSYRPFRPPSSGKYTTPLQRSLRGWPNDLICSPSSKITNNQPSSVVGRNWLMTGRHLLLFRAKNRCLGVTPQTVS